VKYSGVINKTYMEKNFDDKDYEGEVDLHSKDLEDLKNSKDLEILEDPEVLEDMGVVTVAETPKKHKGVPGKGKAKAKKAKAKASVKPSGTTPDPVEIEDKSSQEETPKFTKKHTDTFGAIVSFVKDLFSMFGGKSVTPLSLYNRLVDHIKFTDVDAIMKAINGFVEFFNAYGKDIFSNTLQNIPAGTKINYGDGGKVYIPIQMYIHRSQPDVKEAIRQHLMTIAAFIQPEKIAAHREASTPTDPTSAPALGVDVSTNEGRFIDGIMKKANSSMANVDASNPMMATMALFQSGIMGDMINGLQQGVGTGDMDIVKLMGMMQGAMGSMMQQGDAQAPQNTDVSPPKASPKAKTSPKAKVKKE